MKLWYFVETTFCVYFWSAEPHI